VTPVDRRILLRTGLCLSVNVVFKQPRHTSGRHCAAFDAHDRPASFLMHWGAMTELSGAKLEFGVRYSFASAYFFSPCDMMTSNRIFVRWAGKILVL